MPAKLKDEINTTEHFQVLPLRSEMLNIQSEWWSGSSNIITYELDELMATKLRALYQRRKGRDLFDIWYVTKMNMIDLDRVFKIFFKYCDFNQVAISKDEFKELRVKKKPPRVSI